MARYHGGTGDQSKGTSQRALSSLPKTYELRWPTFLTRIASFRKGYLMSGGFVGSPRPGSVESVRSLELSTGGMNESDSPAPSQASDVGSIPIARSRNLVSLQ